MSCKITLIGAGSVVFAKTLIGDVLQRSELSDSQICLMDVSPERLKIADIMMRQMVATLGVKATIESTLNQQDAIRGAKYVICTVQVGGYKPSTVHDFEIPKKYGLRQTIADTLGVGGIFRGLRTIPVINQIARDIADYAHPDCLFLNYTNPMAMNCWALDEAVGVPHVGLCHSVFGTARMLASHVGVPYDDINYFVAGVNHMAFFLRFEYRGQDLYPLLFRQLEDPDRSFEHVRYEMMRRTGYFVTESSEHQSEYVPYFIHHGQKMIERFKIPLDEYIRRCEAINASWKSTESELLGTSSEMEVGEPSHEYGSYIIHARETNTPTTVYGNVPNRGLIDNLLPGCCVEVPCLVDGSGLHPVHVGALPDQLAALCMTNVNVQRLVVSAALTGKREHIYHALMLDPHTSATLELDQIWAMCDELIEAHQKDGFLGEFAPVVSNTGRSYRGIADRVIARLATRQLCLNRAGSEFELEVSVDNPSSTAWSGELALSVNSGSVEMHESSLEFEVQSGEVLVRVVKGRVLVASEDAVEFMLESLSTQVLALGVTMSPRRKLSAGEDGVIGFDVQLSGFEAASGELRMRADELSVRVCVNDTDVACDVNEPAKRSSVELFLGIEGEAHSQSLFIVPEDVESGVGAVVWSDGQAVEGVELALKPAGVGYEFEAVFSLSLFELPKGGPFLFDIATTVNALGDAHSGGRAALSGHVDLDHNPDHYVAVDFSPVTESLLA